MSKLLIQILKNSLLPAATLIVSKLLGLYLVVQFFDINLYLENQIGNIFTVQLFIDDRAQTLLVNSYSNLVMLLFLAGVTAYLTVRYTLYQKSEGNPRTIVKLTKLNLLNWVTSKQSAFTKVFIWTIFLFAACALIVTSTLNGETYDWVGMSGFVIAILSMWSLIRTFEIETAKIYPDTKPDYF